MIKLIASDIDGTLINSQSECSPKTIAALKAAKAQGIKFAICSGRPVSGIKPLLALWKLEDIVDYIVGMNGGEVLNIQADKFVTCYPLAEDVIKELMDEYEPMGYIPTYYDETGLYCQTITADVIDVATRTATPYFQGDVRALTKGAQPKLMFILPPDKMVDIESYYQAHQDPRYVAFKTAKDLFEFSHPLLAKDIGIKIICAQLGIDMQQVLAFGDTTNDIQMLQEAGIGVCMANGTADAKAVADYITDSCDEDGIANYLNKYVL
ncbi:MAG: Cof-type HAD-IIB family hydrolase [Erysipelotrichaceae bacterium]|nr:Cof-type HAD-IIB family hydrolase [Erysipelotrichaceae bacterium]MDY5252001.1 Cof-type HAD-IIB family hydrolase [Erysipelotrichaceae bacterium]